MDAALAPMACAHCGWGGTIINCQRGMHVVQRLPATVQVQLRQFAHETGIAVGGAT
jgi:hypothetical protein